MSHSSPLPMGESATAFAGDARRGAIGVPDRGTNLTRESRSPFLSRFPSAVTEQEDPTEECKWPTRRSFS